MGAQLDIGRRIAIVGSVDPGRSYAPPVRGADRVHAACEALGRELAAQGCAIIVYSSSGAFIEASVVRGYVEAGGAGRGSVQVRAPRASASHFPEQDRHPDLFDVRPDASPDWEVNHLNPQTDRHR